MRAETQPTTQPAWLGLRSQVQRHPRVEPSKCTTRVSGTEGASLQPQKSGRFLDAIAGHVLWSVCSHRPSETDRNRRYSRACGEEGTSWLRVCRTPEA